MAITKIGTPELFDFSATNTALQLPTGDTASRPAAPSAGEWRFNTDEKYVEYWDGGAWRQIDTEALPNPDDFPSQNFNPSTYFGTDVSHKIDAKFNEAANFNGASSGSQIFIADADVFSPANNDLSFSVWINTKSTNVGYIACKQNDGVPAYEWQFYMNTNGTVNISVFTSAGSTIATATSTATVNDGNWHNVAFVIDTNTSITVYVDKAGVTSSSWSGTMTNTATDVGLGYGGENMPGNRLEGALDQARFFNTALTSTQIDSLYDSETTTTAATLDFPSGAGCFAAYPLDGDASDLSGTYGGFTTEVGYTGLLFQPDFVWIKRTNSTESHALYDSARGINKQLSSDTSDAEATNTAPFEGFTSFDTNGFTVDNNGATNRDPNSYVSWAFRGGGAPTTDNVAGVGNVPTSGSVKVDDADSTAALTGTIVAKKISANTNSAFSIVQYDGTGTAGTIDHLLGVVPNLVIVKRTDDAGNWIVGSTEVDSNSWTKILQLDLADAEAGYTGFNDTPPTTSVFSLGDKNPVNNSSGNYIAYCFANKNGYQRVGSYTGDGNTSGNYIYTTSDGTASGTDGFEPAFLLLKNTNTGGTSWLLYDNKRTPTNPIQTALIANSSGADVTTSSFKINFFTNGFEVTGNGSDINGSGDTFIYLAIAADKDSSVPTQANSFSPTLYTGNATARNISTPFAPDFTWIKSTTVASSHGLYDTIRGGAKWITSNGTNSTQDTPTALQKFNPNGFSLGDDSGAWGVNASGATYISWNWKAGGLPTINNDGSTTSIVSVNQAAGFSIVRYRGNSAANQTVGHGLGTGNIPKLILFKKFTGTSDWPVYSSALTDASYNLYLNKADAQVQNNNPFNGTAPTDTVFTVEQNAGNVNDNGQDIIAYCFADVTSYQQIGSYAGNTVTNPSITTGFSPSFVVIKELNGSNPWVCIDSARAPTNPASCRLRLNATDTEYCAATEAINRSGTGFEVASNWDGMNGNGKTYLYWAIK